ncbi:hypothetical protein DXG01_002730 [Tephrocybe rancida]|nr:hypothetical protein DXG01_002730 [Tephrocybe rancida]
MGRSHEMSLLPIAGQPIFDYAVVTPSSSTYLEGLTMVLDDTDSWITYKGSGWTSKSGMQFSAGLPYNGTQRGSSNPGDYLTVNFEGRSVAVYGLLNQLPGKLLTTYRVDDMGPAKFVAYDGSQTSEPDKWALHQSFFKTDLSAGKHTLTITVNEVTESQVFWIDYITFEATSATTLTQPGGFEDPDSSPLGSKIVGAIVGVVVIIFVVIYLISRCCWRRDPWEILFERMPGILAKHNAPRGPVEVPTRPHMLRQPPHLASLAPDDMTLFELQSAANALREENQNLYNASSTSYHSPPYHPRGTASYPSHNYLQTGYDPPPASSSDIHIPLLAVTSSHGSAAEVAALRNEIERLRRENYQMQVTRNPRRSGAIDAGPADAPPAYNPANYIP